MSDPCPLAPQQGFCDNGGECSMCLVAVSKSACPYCGPRIQGGGLHRWGPYWLPSCKALSVLEPGDYCEGDHGDCGTLEDLDNCCGAYDIYQRVDCALPPGLPPPPPPPPLLPPSQPHWVVNTAVSSSILGPLCILIAVGIARVFFRRRATSRRRATEQQSALRAASAAVEQLSTTYTYSSYGRSSPTNPAETDLVSDSGVRREEGEGAGSAPGLYERDCAICLGEFVDGESVRELPCGHCYHVACIDRWFIQAQLAQGKLPSCPLCLAVPGVTKPAARPSAGPESQQQTAAGAAARATTAELVAGAGRAVGRLQVLLLSTFVARTAASQFAPFPPPIVLCRC